MTSPEPDNIRMLNVFHLIGLADLLDKEPEQTQWTVEGLLPAGGTSLLVAKPKVGKTTLSRQLAVSIASGVPFLGRQTAQGGVIYLAFEEKDDEFVKGLLSLQVDRNLEMYFHFGDAPDDGFAALAQVAQIYSPALIVVDTIAYMMNVKDFNDYGSVQRELKTFTQIARSSGAHILLLHHEGKARGGGINSALGSTAFTGGVDTIMRMGQNEQGRTIETQQRYGESLTATSLRMNNNGYMDLGETVYEAKVQTIEDKVLEFMGNRMVGAENIVTALQMRRADVLAALANLMRDGAVMRFGSGTRSVPYTYAVATDEADNGLD